MGDGKVWTGMAHAWAGHGMNRGGTWEADGRELLGRTKNTIQYNIQPLYSAISI